MAADELGTGYRLGEYRIVRRIGEGRFGVVYEAVRSGSMGFTRRVAIKRIHPFLVRDEPHFVQSMIDGARDGRLLHHANIVDILEVGQEHDDWFLATEYVDGSSLAEVLDLCGQQAVSLPGLAVVDLALQVCRGLQYAHELRDTAGQPRKLVHGDIQPSTVMLAQDGSARILNFGLARAAAELSDDTLGRVFDGTRELTPASDTFALGALLFEMITGERPWDALTPAAQGSHASFDDLESKLATADHVIAGSRAVLRRALDPGGEHRYGSAADMARDLAELRRNQTRGPDLAEVMARLRDGGVDALALAAAPSFGCLHSLDGDEVAEFSTTLTVGRHWDNDLVIAQSRISARHAVVECRDGRWQIRDLGSCNGTSVNKRRVRGTVAVRAGDVVRFAGSSRWRVGPLADPGRAVQALSSTVADTVHSNTFDLDLYLAFDGPDEGIIRVDQRGHSWSVRTGQRFFLLHLLATAGGAWVTDEELRIGLWGRGGAAEVAPSALYKLIHDTRKMLAARGVDGKLVQKSQGRTRIRLDPSRIHLESSEAPGSS